MEYFNQKNTDGYTDAKLAEANALFEGLTAGLNAESDSDEIQHIGERILVQLDMEADS